MPSNKSEHRRSSKPLMEKRRRARINQSLGELKSFILETAKKENCRRSKLEKADILELTVKHLQNLHKLKNSSAQEETKVTGKFVAGFNQCANEVSKFVSTLDGIDATVQARLLSHLNSCVTTLEPDRKSVVVTTTCSSSDGSGTNSSTVSSTTATTTCQPLSTIYPVKIELPSSQSPSSQQSTSLISGFQVITTGRLPSGDVAFIVPSNAIGSPNVTPAAAAASSPSPTTTTPTPVMVMRSTTTTTTSTGRRSSSPSSAVSCSDESSNKSVPSSPRSENSFFFGQPEQTSPLALSQRSRSVTDDDRSDHDITENCVWRPW